MMDLFSQAAPPHEPLSSRMRPRTLDEYIGQDHIVGPGRLLRRSIQADQLSSVIFYGPPGTGKTTLARVIANSTKSLFITLNAVLSGIKEIRESIEEARRNRELYGRKTILFVDEVHRWNKSQQDALLPWVENGTVILIGATTENPYFEVNQALVSRSRVFQLTTLSRDDLLGVALAALKDAERGYGRFAVSFEEGALEHLVDVASGDARSLLNAIELAVETTPESYPPPEGEIIHITMQAAEESIQKKVVLYDKEGDYHFDTISAFIKSLRGSDPDAALYWLAKMMRAGEDPRYVLRRMIISAGEDIGLADPQALVIAESAARAYERIGLPEGYFPLAQAALYLATAPKSNSVLGFFDAMKAIEDEDSRDVPNHLRDDSRDKKAFGHGDGYLYPHAYRDHWVAQQYLPSGLTGRVFYRPSSVGYESRIRDQVLSRREIQLETIIGSEDPPDVLTYSPPDRDRDKWLDRAEGRKGKQLGEIRDRLFALLEPSRHERIFIPEGEGGFLVWEALRRCPEGGVFTCIRDEVNFQAVEYLCHGIPESERPVMARGAFFPELPEALKDPGLTFEGIISRNVFSRSRAVRPVAELLSGLLAPGGRIALSEIIPSQGQRLSSYVSAEEFGSEAHEAWREAEDELYFGAFNPLSFTPEDISISFPGLECSLVSPWTVTEKRILGQDMIDSWFTVRDGLSYGAALEKRGGQLREKAKKAVGKLAGREVEWTSSIVYFLFTRPVARKES